MITFVNESSHTHFMSNDTHIGNSTSDYQDDSNDLGLFSIVMIVMLGIALLGFTGAIAYIVYVECKDKCEKDNNRDNHENDNVNNNFNTV